MFKKVYCLLFKKVYCLLFKKVYCLLFKKVYCLLFKKVYCLLFKKVYCLIFYFIMTSPQPSPKEREQKVKNWFVGTQIGSWGHKLVRGDTNQVDNDCGACAKATIESITKMLKTKDFFIFVVLLFSLI